MITNVDANHPLCKIQGGIVCVCRGVPSLNNDLPYPENRAECEYSRYGKSRSLTPSTASVNPHLMVLDIFLYTPHSVPTPSPLRPYTTSTPNPWAWTDKQFFHTKKWKKGKCGCGQVTLNLTHFSPPSEVTDRQHR